MSSVRIRLAPLVAPVGCVAAVLADLVSPVHFLTCPFKMATGLDCPFCGMTRAARSLVRGDAATAAGFNVLIFAVAPLAAYWFASRIATAFSGRPLPVPRVSRAAGWTIAALVLAFAVVRNLPFGPAAGLASYR